jgi:lysophospholipase L1-like esterase
MITKAKERRIPVLLLTPTADLSAKWDDPGDPLNQQAKLIRAIAGEQQVGLVDSLDAFRSHVKRGGSLPDLMAQGNHPNRKGHDLVVKRLLEWFPEGKEPPSQPSSPPAR